MADQDAEMIADLRLPFDDREGRIGPWAPGGYRNKCHGCGLNYEGDKRALLCKPCAVIGLHEKRDRLVADRLSALIAENAALKAQVAESDRALLAYCNANLSAPWGTADAIEAARERARQGEGKE